MKMNPDKCAFGVTSGQFLGFMIHERGIEIGSKSKEAIRDMVPPTTKPELQKLIGQINYIRRFIPNLSAKLEAFMPLIKTQRSEDFIWGPDQQLAFEKLKAYLVSPPMMAPPRLDIPFIIYISADDASIGSVLMQEVDGKEQVVHYLSRRLLDAETRYSEMERLCLCLYFTCTKLRHYLLDAETLVICKADIIKYMLSAPILKGRLGKWMFALSEFDIKFRPAKAIKGQALADLITERSAPQASFVNVNVWTMYFDGSSCDDGCGVGILIISP